MSGMWRACFYRMKILDEIKQDMTGAALLRDWLGDDGIPVNEMIAEFRAQRCIMGNDGEPCPLNSHENWWDKVKHAVADWIRAQLSLKHKMNISLADDPHLHMCSACGCCLKLKVWVPNKHLRDHTSKEVLDKTVSYCWMRKELT